jgi:lysine 2-monooxygenase
MTQEWLETMCNVCEIEEARLQDDPHCKHHAFRFDPEELAKDFETTDYIRRQARDEVTREGDFYVDLERNEIVVKLLPAIYPHHIVGVTENGESPDWRPRTPEEWDRFRNDFSFKGASRRSKRLRDWGFQPLLRAVGSSQECVFMIRDYEGFAAPYDTRINAGTALQLFHSFPLNPRFMTLQGGYELLVHCLENAVRNKGCDVRTNHKLLSINEVNGYFELVAKHTESPFRVKFLTKNVILALPQLALEELRENNPSLRNIPVFKKLLHSVVTIPLTKINLFFGERWWYTRFNISNGGSFTDLPIGQVYCYDPDDIKHNQGPGVLTMYCDSSRRNFWQDLQEGSPSYKYKGANYDSELTASATKASEDVVDEVMNCLRELFDHQDLPQPFEATYQSWGLRDTGDSEHQWGTGIDDRIVRSSLVKVRDGLAICGESYSDEQGWVEGALRSAAEVLRECFGVSTRSAASAVR